jgi:hypothetical protein
MSELETEVAEEAVEEAEVVAVKRRDRKDDEPRTLSAREDPRAMAGIRRGKGLGGLTGFALAGLAAHMHGELIASVLLRALAGGMVGYLLGWLAAVTVWRRIIRAELHHTIEMAARARSAAVAAAAAAAPQGEGR